MVIEEGVKQILESLSPNERKILFHLKEGNLKKISEAAGLDLTSTFRALEFLSNKKILVLKQEAKKIISLDINGHLYLKKGLPERRLLHLLAEKKALSLDEARKTAGLSDNEFKAALGALKKKALLNLVKGKLILQAKQDEIAKKSLEEQFLETLPLKLEDLKDEQKLAFNNLKNRKKLIIIEEEKEVFVKITELGEQLLTTDIEEVEKNKMIEKLTPQMIKTNSWKGKKFRRYDIVSPLPRVAGGKRHFVNQAIDYARKIWTEMGFQEMTGTIIQSGFWNFDALFTAQDHPVREIHDTFFINQQSPLPDKKIVKEIRKAHEQGTEGSKGWRYEWKESEARKTLLRTHTTCLSAQTLSKLKKQDLPRKFFAIGPNFRNETIDWNHGFELLQTEGIVVDKDANFRHLIGYLKEFAKKMGFEKIRFRPAYFPYTEPSLEGDVWNEEKKEWVELIAAGIFRPEVTEALFGEPIPVLAWGPGFGRMIMSMFNIKDIRDLNKNNLTQLREMKFL
jgi:phenylalanyl-tRNA synthetase alpha chain